ncbi:uncharacterized protein LOC113038370, partial [Tachysurus ichikawai]
MAPVCVAGRLFSLALIVFVLFLLATFNNVDSLLVYDRQTLLNIRANIENMLIYNSGGSKTSPHLHDLPAYLCRKPLPAQKKKRHRRRGKRGGLLVKIKSRLAVSRNPRRTSAEYQVDDCIYISMRSLDPVYTWLVPVVDANEESWVPQSVSPSFRRGGVNSSCPRVLDREPRIANKPAPARIAL